MPTLFLEHGTVVARLPFAGDTMKVRMGEEQGEAGVAALAADIIREHGRGAVDHVLALIEAAVHEGNDDAVLRLDRAMRHIERLQKN